MCYKTGQIYLLLTDGKVIKRKMYFESGKLQIPADKHRCHYVKANVRVHRYENDSMAVFHGPRRGGKRCHGQVFSVKSK